MPYSTDCIGYLGTQHTYWVYVPQQYDPSVPASLMIFQDGQAFKCGRICAGLEWGGKGKSARPIRGCRRGLFPTDEELLIARDKVRCILGEPHPVSALAKTDPSILSKSDPVILI